jgi:ubiquinone/menaquinone biosynthesis C-methylase UbiE
MNELDRADINTKGYWNEMYNGKQRGGWWFNMQQPDQSHLKDFLVNDIQGIGCNAKLIEIGGGDGYSANRIRMECDNIEAWNLDISSLAIEAGKAKYPDVQHICCDLLQPVEHLTLNSYFDILICQEVIEHLADVHTGIKHIISFLKPGGLACFTFPNNEGNAGSEEHLWSFTHNDLPELFFRYTDEIVVCDFRPFNPNHLHILVKFKKTL